MSIFTFVMLIITVASLFFVLTTINHSNSLLFLGAFGLSGVIMVPLAVSFFVSNQPGDGFFVSVISIGILAFFAAGVRATIKNRKQV